MRAFPLLLTLAAAPLAIGCGPWFEEAPPTLAALNERLPAKSMGEIFLEAAPPIASEPADYDAELRKMTARLKSEPGAALVPAVDALLLNAREHYSGGETCNLLHDMRDVLAGSATAEEQRAYIEWRLAHGSGTEVEVDARIAAASEAMRPHWIYLRGALVWSLERLKSQRWFDWIVAEWPEHPRAEFALFMSARCRLSRTLMHTWQEKVTAEQLAAERADARARFDEYLKDYPKGRLVADTEGWLGGLEYRTGDHMEALRRYLRQAEAPGHPELLKSCAFMCEKTLDAIVSGEAPDEEAFALVARHPRVAMGLMYLVLNSPEADSFNGEPDDSARVRRWRREVLPRIAAAVAVQRGLYENDAWQPRYLALMAQAASAVGDQASALQLTAGEKTTDDLLLARGVALQRAGQPGEAADVLGSLAKEFPMSPLAKGARLRRALALVDAHRAGEAVVALRALLPDEQIHDYGNNNSVYPPADDQLTAHDSAVIREMSGAEDIQVAQNIDALLNFAPVVELAVMLESPDLDAAAKSEMRAVLAQRCLVAEDFEGARKFMTPAQFNLTAGALAEWARNLETARPDLATVVAQAVIGDAWAAARGKVLVAPLDTVPARELICFDDFRKASLQRRANGKAMGLGHVDQELEDRDELRHAWMWWMRAADGASATPLGSKLRLKALEAMPRIARASEFAYRRALETDAEKLSREIYERLLAEAPDSREARQAAWWSFAWVPQDDDAGRIYRLGANPPKEFAGYFFDAYPAFPEPDRAERSLALTWKEIEAGTLALRNEAWRVESEELAKRAAQLTAAARLLTVNENGAAVVNCLDDLALFFQEPNLTPEMRRRYAELRLDLLARSSWPDAPFAPVAEIAHSDEAMRAVIQKTLADPAMKPIADFVDFLDLAMVANHTTREPLPALDKDGEHFTYPSRDFRAVERMARAFLKKYPRSRKREAAAMVLARSVHRQSWPHVQGYETALDGSILSTSDYGDNNAAFIAQMEPFDPQRVLAPLDAYDREFPGGRYAATVRDYRATVLWRTRQWGEALDLTLAQLDDAAHRELHDDAAARLANIFADLMRPEARPDLLAAIRERPAAVERLREYLAVAQSPQHPLWFLRGFLEESVRELGRGADLGLSGAVGEFVSARRGNQHAGRVRSPE